MALPGGRPVFPHFEESRHVQSQGRVARGRIERRRLARGPAEPGPCRGQPKNGAKSRGPVTPEGKARASRNALKHGLCASHHVVVEGESAEAFAAFEAALVADLAPAGALQTLLAGRIARAAWRLERAERIEAELFAREMEGVFGDGDLGLALIRDGNGARAFDTLLRYRGAAQAELFRTLRTLKALQADAPAREPAPASPPELPNKPDARGNPGETVPIAAADETEAARDPAQAHRTAEPANDHRQPEHHFGAPGPIEPETPRDSSADGR